MRKSRVWKRKRLSAPLTTDQALSHRYIIIWTMILYTTTEKRLTNEPERKEGRYIYPACFFPSFRPGQIVGRNDESRRQSGGSGRCAGSGRKLCKLCGNYCRQFFCRIRRRSN